VQVYRFGGDDRNAIESARDLTMLYPTTRYAALAKEYLDKQPPEAKKQDAGKDADVAK
jgi:outer membrane protein assembly factor BamD (BamD/ComL family)